MDEASRETWGLTPPRLRALYAAAVIGLIVFIAAALLFPPPIHSYSARAVLEQTAQVGSQAPLELDLLTQSQVQQQAQDSFLALTAKTQSTTTFQQAVSCQVERPTPQQVRITLETRDRYADRSLDLCRGIARDLVEKAEKSFVPGVDSLRSERANVEQRLALVRESKRAAEDELAALTREHVTQVTSAMQAATGKDGLGDSVFAERQRLGSEWQQLLAQRSELARTRTDEHPQVKDIDQRLVETKKRLDALTALDKAKPQQQSLDNLQDDFRRRSLELTNTVAADRRREEELLSAAARLAITPAAIVLSTTVVEEPELVERLGGQPSEFQLAVLSLLAIAAGGLTYQLLRQWSAQKTLSSAEDIELQLELPVISLSAPHRSTRARRWDPIVRRSLQGAEVGLLVMAAAMFLLVALQSELVEPVAADPFGAVAESLDRTFSPTFRR